VAQRTRGIMSAITVSSAFVKSKFLIRIFRTTSGLLKSAFLQLLILNLIQPREASFRSSSIEWR
jgi:hypothetical protein